MAVPTFAPAGEGAPLVPGSTFWLLPYKLMYVLSEVLSGTGNDGLWLLLIYDQSLQLSGEGSGTGVGEHHLIASAE